jgi:hypothetical protein
MKKTLVLFMTFFSLLSLYPATAFAGDPLGVTIDITWKPEEAIPESKVNFEATIGVIHTEDESEYAADFEVIGWTYRVIPTCMSWSSYGGFYEEPPEDYTKEVTRFSRDWRITVLHEVMGKGAKQQYGSFDFSKYWQYVTLEVQADVKVAGMTLQGTEAVKIERYRYPAEDPYASFQINQTCVETRTDNYRAVADSPVTISWGLRGGKTPYINSYFSADASISYATEGNLHYATLYKNIGGSSSESGSFSTELNEYRSISFDVGGKDYNLDVIPNKHIYVEVDDPVCPPFPYDFSVTPDKTTYYVGDTALIQCHIGFPYARCTCNTFLNGARWQEGIPLTGDPLEFELTSSGYLQLLFTFDLLDDSRLEVSTGIPIGMGIEAKAIVHLPVELKEIGDEAFLGTNIEVVYLPDGVIVGKNAFPEGVVIKKPE